MNDLVVIVEGETEQTFVRDQLAAHLPLHGTNVWPVLPGRHRKKGGVKKWEIARKDIIRTLNEGRYCSTMFDYYALLDDWPGRIDACSKPWKERAIHVENQILEHIVPAMDKSFNRKYFIPYIQLHEFEALTFANVNVLVSVTSPLVGNPTKKSLLDKKFSTILEEAGHPEAINDSYETCPSRRISKIVPAYKKRVYGPIITGRIGLKVLRDKCDHFASWLQRLENINS